MTASIVLNESFPCEVGNEEDLKFNCEKILSLTSLSLKMFAKSFYKTSTELEPTDIDQIKSSLNNYRNDSDKINDFKNELIKDLSNFQQKIKISHEEKIETLKKQKHYYERTLLVVDCKKHKLIMDRLAKIAWPYDDQTKEYDNQIAKLKIQIQQCAQKLEELRKAPPKANEKDILLYQMHLKEKYSRK